MTTSTMFRKALAALSLVVAAATPAAAQLGVTVSTPLDPGGSYFDTFGQTGATSRFAQTFQIPTGASNQLQRFTLSLGDATGEGTGSGLTFRAGVYAMAGTQLGTQLFLSDVRNGSGNFDGFDAYTFLTPGLTLTPTNGLFALVLQAVGGGSAAQNVIAASNTNYAGGAFFAVTGNGQLSPLTGIFGSTTDAAFSLTFAPAVTATPEPATLVLVGTGLIGVAGIGKRRRNRS